MNFVAKLRITREQFLILIVVFPFFLSYQITNMFNLGALSASWRLFDLFIVVVLYLYRNVLPSKITCMLLVLWMTIFFSSLLNNNDVYASAIKILSIFTFILLVDYFYKKNSINCLKCLLFVFEILIYSNLVAIIVFPQGFNEGDHEKIWLLDNYSAQLKWFLPAVCVAFDYTVKTKLTNRTYFLYAAIFITTILSGSATLTSTVAVMIILWIFVKKNIIIVNIKTGIEISLIFLIGIVVFRLQDNFSFIIETLLNRNLSFTGRTDIWNSALYMFCNQPIIGYGYWVYPPVPHWSPDLYTSVNGVAVASHAHCQFLHFLIQGGIIFFSGFVVLNLWLSTKLNKNNSLISRFAGFIIFLILLAGCVETMYDSPLVFLPYIIAYYSICKNTSCNYRSI